LGFAYQAIVHSFTQETLFFFLYGRNAKFPTALSFFIFFPVIYSEYGASLFKKLDMI